MIKIRKSVFETNSSSSHSLVYQMNSRTGKPYDKEEIDTDDLHLYDFYGDDPENGILGVWFGSYGWDGEPCKHFRTKLAYILTQNSRGYGMDYYGDLGYENRIEIKTQEDWDNVIENYVMKQPGIRRILDFIQKKCPQIKGFKFYWYNPQDDWELEHEYRNYKYDKNIENDIKIPPMDDPFYNTDIGYRFKVGFGGVDHQSAGYLSNIKDLDSYLFDNNVWVVITNDNTY